MVNRAVARWNDIGSYPGMALLCTTHPSGLHGAAPQARASMLGSPEVTYSGPAP